MFITIRHTHGRLCFGKMPTRNRFPLVGIPIRATYNTLHCSGQIDLGSWLDQHNFCAQNNVKLYSALTQLVGYQLIIINGIYNKCLPQP